MYELKILRGVVRYDNEEWFKIWNRIDLLFRNWHEEFSKFWPEHSKISKIWTLMGWFWSKYIIFPLQKVQRTYIWLHSRLIQILKENWLVLPKTDMKNLATTRALASLQIRTLMATSFCLKLKIYELEIYRGVMCQDNEEWCKTWRGIDLSVQNWHEQFDKFWPEHSKISKISILKGCFWLK